MINVGTKSLLFGVHQVIWHPLTVYKAWIKLYGRPSWKECVCIVIHDWGYWGKPNMDGSEGSNHPELGASIAGKLFGKEYSELCLLHSRTYANKVGKEPSKLCWADKLSIAYEAKWTYLIRARLSGEIKEYRNIAACSGFISRVEPHEEWFSKLKELYTQVGLSKRGEFV